MSRSTPGPRNGDGASNRGEPSSTVPERDWDGMRRVARLHSCDTVGELITAPSVGGHGEYSPRKASCN
jgi:hypothetical protein